MSRAERRRSERASKKLTADCAQCGAPYNPAGLTGLMKRMEIESGSALCPSCHLLCAEIASRAPAGLSDELFKQWFAQEIMKAFSRKE